LVSRRERADADLINAGGPIWIATPANDGASNEHRSKCCQCDKIPSAASCQRDELDESCDRSREAKKDERNPAWLERVSGSVGWVWWETHRERGERDQKQQQSEREPRKPKMCGGRIHEMRDAQPNDPSSAAATEGGR